MAMAVRQSNADGITQWGMSRATPEATGRRHWTTTHSALPQQRPGQQQAILMAAAVRRYNTGRIAQ